ncbi:hypothetical protein [Burkholderia stagnalis]|uniref:hypothetical protein n=1 Tax=Burkholderia stagnalis TaxID=1503054 RepID=UPI00325A9333
MFERFFEEAMIPLRAIVRGRRSEAFEHPRLHARLKRRRCRGMRKPDRFRAGLVGRYCRRLGRRCGEEGARGLDGAFERLDIGIITRAGTNG